jgi:hypothetical protein
MKLYEALHLRKALESDRTSLGKELGSSMRVRADEKDQYRDPGLISTEYNSASLEALGLVKKINRTNSATLVTDPISGNEVSLLELIAIRESHSRAANVYRLALENLTQTGRRGWASHSEAPMVNVADTVDVKQWLQGANAAVRTLDTAIQHANVLTELMEE